MLLAKIALALGGTALLAGAYAFHEGIIQIDARSRTREHVHIWLPAAVVPLAMHFIPKRYLQDRVTDVESLTMLHALAKGLRKYPEAELVEVREETAHVYVRTLNAKLLIDVETPDNTVHVSCPLSTIEDVSRELQSMAPGI
jgi:hypothetical protein